MEIDFTNIKNLHVTDYGIYWKDFKEKHYEYDVNNYILNIKIPKEIILVEGQLAPNGKPSLKDSQSEFIKRVYSAPVFCKNCSIPLIIHNKNFIIPKPKYKFWWDNRIEKANKEFRKYIKKVELEWQKTKAFRRDNIMKQIKKLEKELTEL